MKKCVKKSKNRIFRIAAAQAAALLCAFVCAPAAGRMPAVSAAGGTPRVYAADAESPAAEGTGSLAVLYDNSNGLPTSEANAIVQTPDGFIWIGGYSGLVRYDGKEFYRFDATTGLTSVVSLFVDSKGRLWIGTNDRGIALYEYGKFTFWGKEQGLLSDSVREITEDADGNIVLATTQGVACIDDQGALSLIVDERLSAQYIFEMAGDGQGLIYGLTLDGDVFVLDRLEVIFFCDSGELPYRKLVSVRPSEWETGAVYFGTEESELIRTNLMEDYREYETIPVSPQTNINYLGVQDGRLWLCADNGIGYLDENERYHEVPGLPMNNSVDGMMTDMEGNLWFVSSRQGVMKIVPNRFTNISGAAGLSEMVINSTCILDGNLYIGTDSGLYVLDQNHKELHSGLTELLAGVRIRCIKADSEGNLWLCTFSGQGLVCLRRDGSVISYNEGNGLNSNRARTMLELSNGDIAVATSGGVNIIRDGEIIAGYGSGDGISNTEILSLCEGEKGTIYAGSDGNGIYVLGQGRIRNLTDEDGLDSEVILMMKKDPLRDGYWVITGNSLAYMEDEKIRLISSFPYSNNFDLFFGEGDRIWIVSSNGLYVVNGNALVRDEVQEYSFYNADSGMYCSATANARSYLDDDGTLYIAGSGYVMGININDVRADRTQVRLAVPFVRMDDETVYFGEGDTLTIPGDCRRVTIYGYACTYALGDPVIRYRLEGFSEEVVTVNNSKLAPISYTNLAGKEYVFHMEALDSETGEVIDEIRVRLVKEKTLFEQWLFRLFLAFMGVAIVALAAVFIVHRRTAAFKNREKKNRKFMNEVIAAFAKAIDIKDKYTNGHSTRVAEYSRLIAQRMDFSGEEVERIYHIALLHDIGKIAVPDAILNKADKLTAEEYEIIKKHAQDGYDVLKEISSYPDIAVGAGYHHERINGQGYPHGCTGDQIPLIAKIVAVADTFDTMNSTRPYRKKMPMHEIVEELRRVAGTQLDADIVKIMIELIEEKKVTGDAAV